MTAAELALWLRSAPGENSAALDDLIRSRDLTVVYGHDGDEIGVLRVDRLIPRLECPEPILPAGAA